MAITMGTVALQLDLVKTCTFGERDLASAFGDRRGGPVADNLLFT